MNFDDFFLFDLDSLSWSEVPKRRKYFNVLSLKKKINI